ELCRSSATPWLHSGLNSRRQALRLSQAVDGFDLGAIVVGSGIVQRGHYCLSREGPEFGLRLLREESRRASARWSRFRPRRELAFIRRGLCATQMSDGKRCRTILAGDCQSFAFFGLALRVPCTEIFGRQHRLAQTTVMTANRKCPHHQLLLSRPPRLVADGMDLVQTGARSSAPAGPEDKLVIEGQPRGRSDKRRPYPQISGIFLMDFRGLPDGRRARHVRK